MSTILVKGTASASGLPVDADLKTHLAGLSSTVAWWQMDAEHATLDGSNQILSISTVNSGGATLSPVSPNVGPPLANESAYSGYSAAQYDSVATSKSLVTTASYFTGSFSVLLFARRGAISATAAAVIQPAGSGGAMTSLQCGADGAWQAWHRGSGLTLDAPAAPDASPRLVIMSYNGTTLRAQVDGYSQKSSSPSGALPANPELTIGGFSGTRFVGDIGDVVILNTAILESSNAPLLDLWRAYFDEVYS